MSKYLDLQKRWENLYVDCSQQTFNALMHQLFAHYVIMRGDVEFRFLELELYYFADNHQDWRVKNKNKDDKMHPFVYERDCEQTGSFFLHQSGVDICFAGKVTDKVEDSCGGGILIRSLLRIEDDKESIVTGPWDCAEALFQYMTEDTVPILHYRKGHLCSEEDIHPTKRCNTNSSIDENEDLCFYDKRYVSNGVWSDLNHIKLERYNPIKRQCVTNRYNNKPWNYGAWTRKEHRCIFWFVMPRLSIAFWGVE